MKPGLVALLLASGIALAEHPLSNPRVYLSQEGFRAVVAQVKAPTPDRCVLMVTGAGGELDGLVLDCRAERKDSQFTYFIIRRGRERAAMRTQGDGSAGVGSGAGPLQYSEADSKKENLEVLWAKHEAQAAQLAAITRFDRPAEAAATAREVTAATAPLNGECGTKLTFTLDWSAAPDEVFKDSQPQQGCLKAIALMKEMCQGWRVARSTFAEKLTEVRCTFGLREPAFTLSGGTLTIATNHLTVTMPGALEQYLKEAL